MRRRVAAADVRMFTAARTFATAGFVLRGRGECGDRQRGDDSHRETKARAYENCFHANVIGNKRALCGCRGTTIVCAAARMLGAGLEPARLATQDPKSCASTNSATRANGCKLASDAQVAELVDFHLKPVGCASGSSFRHPSPKGH